MKFKGEKGIVGTDITVALIIILLFMSLIYVLFFNITKISKGTERKSQATYIATNIIEAIKSKNYDSVEETDGEKELIVHEDGIYYPGQLSNIPLGEIDGIEAGYTCTLDVKIFVPEQYKGTAEEEDIVKTVKVKVQYKVANEVQGVELNTVLLK